MINKRIVVKIGTSTLTAGSSNVSLPQLIELIRQISTLHSRGHELIITSSGAVAAGKEVLTQPQLTKLIPFKQMLSAIGQPRLMSIYTQIFSMYEKNVAQVLLTREDLSDRKRYLNAHNTLEALLLNGVIPVINENDTVATEEIRVGDNDNLSALVSNLVGADMLILLTDQPGLFTSDPRQNKDALLIHEIAEPDIPKNIWDAAGGSGSEQGTGGMVTKVQAADLARRSGTRVVIAKGDEPDVILKIIAGKRIGTHFLPVISQLESRKRYILSGIKNSSKIHIDEGAVHALRQGGSLLPVGVTEVNGSFERGDTVVICDSEGTRIAIGLVNYSSVETDKIKQLHSDQIDHILNYNFGNEVVHHNNMLIL